MLGGRMIGWAVTLTVNGCVATPPRPSWTRTATSLGPNCAAAGVHWITPFALMVMPAGAVANAGSSASSASTRALDGASATLAGVQPVTRRSQPCAITRSRRGWPPVFR